MAHYFTLIFIKKSLFEFDQGEIKQKLKHFTARRFLLLAPVLRFGLQIIYSCQKGKVMQVSHKFVD